MTSGLGTKGFTNSEEGGRAAGVAGGRDVRVDLLQKTPDYLRMIWLAARTCYSSLSPRELALQQPDRDDMIRLAKHIVESGHHSVLEHCHMTFAVEGASRALLAQYSRHRIGISLSVQSQRYVSHHSEKRGGLFPHVVPPQVQEHPRAREVMADAMKRAQEAYDQLLSLGIRKEDARFVLPGGACTNFVTSLNLRSLLDVYKKRVVVRGAQWEIATMVREMARLIVHEEAWLGRYFPGLEESA